MFAAALTVAEMWEDHETEGGGQRIPLKPLWWLSPGWSAYKTENKRNENFLFPSFDHLTPMSDQDRISPSTVNKTSSRQVMRIKIIG